MSVRKMIMNAHVDETLTIHCTLKKSNSFPTKIVSLEKFIKQMKFPHEHIKILYHQEMTFQSKAFLRLLKKFEDNYYDFKDFKYDDRRNKFEYHLSFYFFHYLSVLSQRSTQCFELFKRCERCQTCHYRKKLCKIELLTRF